jgi:hypothetical protein
MCCTNWPPRAGCSVVDTRGNDADPLEVPRRTGDGDMDITSGNSSQTVPNRRPREDALRSVSTTMARSDGVSHGRRGGGGERSVPGLAGAQKTPDCRQLVPSSWALIDPLRGDIGEGTRERNRAVAPKPLTLNNLEWWRRRESNRLTLHRASHCRRATSGVNPCVVITWATSPQFTPVPLIPPEYSPVVEE